MGLVLDTRWEMRWEDVYAAAMHCKTTPEEQWDQERMDLHPSGAIEFCDIVTADALRSMSATQIQNMAKGYVSMGANNDSSTEA